MLDAAHGEPVGPVVTVQRVHVARMEVQVACVDITGGVGRRRPVETLRADIRQGSRRVAAVARGRRAGKAIAGMNDPEKPATAAPEQTGIDNWQNRKTADETFCAVLLPVDC